MEQYREITEREFNRALLGILERKQPEDLLAIPEVFSTVSAALKTEVEKEIQKARELDERAQRLDEILDRFGDGLEKPVEFGPADFKVETGNTTTADDIALMDVVGNVGGISNYLRDAGYKTLGDVKGVSAKILLNVIGVGPKTVEKINGTLKEYGLRQLRDMKSLYEKA